MAEVLKGTTEQITPRQFHEADGAEDWRVVCESRRCGSTARFTISCCSTRLRIRPQCGPPVSKQLTHSTESCARRFAWVAQNCQEGE